MSRHPRQHLEACRTLGAGACVTATPASLDTHVSSPLFRVALHRRLHTALWDHDSACGMCGEVLDRVLRHNAIRNVVCSAVAEVSSISPGLEKPGLLLPPRLPGPWRCWVLSLILVLTSPPPPPPPPPGAGRRVVAEGLSSQSVRPLWGLTGETRSRPGVTVAGGPRDPPLRGPAAVSWRRG